MEIERKWLTDKAKVTDVLLKRHHMRRQRITQYYLNSMEDEWLIRLRSEGDNCYVTLKSKGLLSREEIEFKITYEEFKQFSRFGKTCLKKNRYTFPISNDDFTCYQIDVYDDYDFITCEIEFESEEKANAFVAPDWCVEDITKDPKYKNVNLAK